MKELREMEPRTVAVLIGLALGLAITVHHVFFLVALVIAGVAMGRAIYEHFRLTHHHP